ncbi:MULTISPECIES: SbcC/MukB-like Walker B domain-containing protein [Deefgea]|uniref:AAA family ATPase n=1 Tax=Deefgea chitinilytica TaxID=570276 RepID=A0ABS2CAA8_9NEIS|nr:MULTISPECIES: SbcC/MukB-like Walker B domain-containing protein [Deefgea]MBM5571098.1 AAA family ATPase [Deefgea chitinilytica]MBM9888328.1 AAA family ATPase [Deefgea sp. CFH1-16]
MKLESLILINWGSLRPGEYPMGNMTLLTGPTGSGKSTMLDALQTGMTAVYQHIFSYNPGQDETHQSARNGKTKRTLWSYIVGAEDNLFARPDGAHGYVGLVFRPSEGETGKSFTALVGAAAKVDGSGDRRQAVQERLALLIIDDAELKFEDLVDVDNEDNMSVVEVERVESHLKSFYPHVLNLRDNKREYLCQLYGRFRGQKVVSFQEAEAAAKAWTQAIAHKPIGSVDELVKSQILEHDPFQHAQRIGQISDLIRQVHNLRKDGERLEVNIERLQLLGDAISQAKKAYEDATLYQALSAKRLLAEDERLLTQAKLRVAELGEKIKVANDSALQANTEKSSYHEGLVNIEARLTGIPAANEKAQLDEREKRAYLSLKTSISELQTALLQVASLQKTALQLIALPIPPEFRAIQSAMTMIGHELSKLSRLPLDIWHGQLEALRSQEVLTETLVVFKLLRDLECIDGSFEPLYEVMAGATQSFVSAVNSQLGALQSLVDAAVARENAAAERKKNLAEGGADYPREVQYALKAFRSDLPNIPVQVLCDLIEPVDQEWMPAIEGYLDGARFNLIVPEEDEERATRFVKGRFPRVRVIQGALCKRKAKPELVPSDSIIHELATEHPIAQAYLIDMYGPVVKVHDFETLRFTSRGVMKDGRAAGGRTFFTADAENLVFGKAQQAIARQKAEEEHVAATKELGQMKEQRQGLNALLDLVKQVKLPTFDAALLAMQTVSELELVWEAANRLDLTEVESLLGEKELLSTQMGRCDEVIGAANRQIGEFNSQIGMFQSSVTQREVAIPNRKAKVIEELEKLKALTEVSGALSYIEMESQIDNLLLSGEGPQNLLETVQTLQYSAREYTSDVRENVGIYNQYALQDEKLDFPYGEQREGSFAPIYGLLVQLHVSVREQLRLQKDTGLYKNLEQLRQAENSFQDVFTKQFCYEIRNAVDTGIRTLKALNTELDKLKFGTDRFRIDWSHWVPEFEEYYKFFSAAYELAETQESGGLFDETALSPENCSVRDRLLKLLLADDQERAQKELQRIADYRNYRRYEIWKESDSGSKVALSEWGTGSGGQLETPAYIVRAAVVTNRLKHFEKGMNLKLLVNDESFAKMDERRAQDVMKFIRDSLGMQLICAMPTKHAGALKAEFTKEWCFTRTAAEGNGEVDFVSEADERELNPDRLRELWEKRRNEVRQQAQILFEATETAGA